MKATIKLSLPYQVSQETLSLITNSEHGDAAIIAIKQAFNEALELAARECDIDAAFFGNGPDSELHPLHARERELHRDRAAAIRKLKVE